jgi:hypothetical protein
LTSSTVADFLLFTEAAWLIGQVPSVDGVVTA